MPHNDDCINALNAHTREMISKVEKIIEDLSDFVNTMSMDNTVIPAMAQRLCRTHRTLQQSTIRLLYGLLVEYSKCLEKYGTDPRNEDAKAFADKVRHLENVYFSFI